MSNISLIKQELNVHRKVDNIVRTANLSAVGRPGNDTGKEEISFVVNRNEKVTIQLFDDGRLIYITDTKYERTEEKYWGYFNIKDNTISCEQGSCDEDTFYEIRARLKEFVRICDSSLKLTAYKMLCRLNSLRWEDSQGALQE